MGNGNGDVIGDWEASEKWPVLRTLTSVTDEDTEVPCLFQGTPLVIAVKDATRRRIRGSGLSL